ncbi:MAG: hypothetical protein DHS20C18_09200 [Saprospiraceae bacterium]|nr:MAG: hypothetical protein DHS20C18_09200 [Saprospiraceae bacterium]
MKILFVVSGNDDRYTIAPFIKSQGESLVERGMEVDYFPIIGKGVTNYLKSIGKLRAHLRNQSYDLIHAHYSLSGWVAVLGSKKIPVVLSLMGDDALGTFKGVNKVEFKSRILGLLAQFIQPFVSAIITKSANLEKFVYRKKISYLIPNGVRLDQFRIDQSIKRSDLGLEENKRYVLFLGSPNDENKNFSLARGAVACLKQPDVELINIYDVPHDIVVKYLNLVNVFVLCSFSEGSPNVVKEAMACGCPMVVTQAGDAAWVVGNTPGCFVASYEPANFAEQLGKALQYGKTHCKTPGRDRIIELGLDAGSIADKIISIYQTLKENK